MMICSSLNQSWLLDAKEHEISSPPVVPQTGPPVPVGQTLIMPCLLRLVIRVSIVKTYSKK
jgi:hypothetical protein